MPRALTTDETTILAFVVPDAQAWFDHAVATFGEARGEAYLAAKLAKWRSRQEAALAAGDYKTRVQARTEHSLAVW